MEDKDSNSTMWAQVGKDGTPDSSEAEAGSSSFPFTLGSQAWREVLP
jgi:hypothetical protein